MMTISTKVTTELGEDIKRAAQISGHTLSDFLRICVEDAVYGHYAIEDGHLVPTDDYLDVLRPPVDELLGDDLHTEKLVKAMRDKGYPDRIIRDRVDSMIDTIKDGGKYNARRDSGEWGC